MICGEEKKNQRQFYMGEIVQKNQRVTQRTAKRPKVQPSRVSSGELNHQRVYSPTKRSLSRTVLQFLPPPACKHLRILQSDCFREARGKNTLLYSTKHEQDSSKECIQSVSQFATGAPSCVTLDCGKWWAFRF